MMVRPEVASFADPLGRRIVADHFRVGADAVVVMANDIFTHRRWRDRYPFIAARLNECGIAALAFDYCGTGESAGAPLRFDTFYASLSAAVGEAKRLGYRRIALWGHAVLSGVCLDVQFDQVSAIVLSGAATGAMDFAAEFEPAELEALRSVGSLVVPSMDPAVRPTQVVDAQLLHDFATADQVKRFRGARVPVLLINGNSADDSAEVARCEGNRRAMQLLPPGSKHVVIEGAKHSFAGHFEPLAQIGVAWLKERLTQG